VTTADTSSIVGASTPWVSLFNPTIYFTVSGIGSGIFTGQTYLHANNANPIEPTFGFFGDAWVEPIGPASYAILGLASPALASYDLEPIGPVADEHWYSAAVDFPTSAGIYKSITLMAMSRSQPLGLFLSPPPGR
jgi:hypothetical protein